MRLHVAWRTGGGYPSGMRFIHRALPVLAALLALPAAASAQGLDAGVDAGDAGVVVREFEIVVNNGYTPDLVQITEGEALRLRFVRRDTSSCSQEVVFPELAIRRVLPTGQPVVIDLPALTAGEYAFQCWMNMLHGRIVVRPRPPSTAPVARPPTTPGAMRPAPRAGR
ncbi:MAG: cupredoxin domain-containing protein [Deltaproteobacteria bacterium]